METNAQETTTTLPNRPLLGLKSATLIVVANMIGAAIFAVSGDMAQKVPSQSALLLSWLIGGIMALCGALAYGELASRFPRSGGEYHFLSKIYHPSIGFVSGFVSLVVGFSASIAANAFVFATYFSKALPFELNVTATAALLVIGLTVLHATNIHYGVMVQNTFAALKMGLITLFIIGGFIFMPDQAVSFSLLPAAQDTDLIFSNTFATSMINVFYAYLGWNAAVYITGEVKDSKRNVPRALIIGTLIVMVLYILINYVFLRAVPLDALKGKIEIGALAAEVLFGTKIANLLSFLIAFALISSTSSMVMAGPRVTQAMGEDYHLFRKAAYRTPGGSPVVALGLQLAIALLLIFTASFFTILGYIGFTLSIFSALTVAGVYLARNMKTTTAQNTDSNTDSNNASNGESMVAKTLGYPVTPLIFIALSGWMVVNTIIEDKDHQVTLFGFGTLVIGFGLYYITHYFEKNKQK